MHVTPGTRVGPYAVVALLGRGMSEVYRATDTRLGRDVALKVVSEALETHGPALERFESKDGADFASRIDDDNRREEEDVLAAFADERPAILAAFLDAVAHGIKTLPGITITKWPRMADFAKWVTACEGAYDTKGTFLTAYGENRANAISALLAEDLVGSVVMRLPLPWQGQIGALLGPLSGLAGDQITKSKEWPKTPRGLGAALRRLVPPLRDYGIEVEPPSKNDKARIWAIRYRVDKPAEDRAVAPSDSPTAQQQPDDKTLKYHALGCSGGLGGCSHTLQVPPHADDDNNNGGHPFFIRREQPEQPGQPDDANSSKDSNGLGSGDQSGGWPDNSPQQPDDDFFRDLAGYRRKYFGVSQIQLRLFDRGFFLVYIRHGRKRFGARRGNALRSVLRRTVARAAENTGRPACRAAIPARTRAARRVFTLARLNAARTAQRASPCYEKCQACIV